MQTALSLRVSTAQQRPDLQADGIHRYATRTGLDRVAEHMDMAGSGRQEGRPQVQALRRAARPHEFAAGLVRKFDRFARSVSHWLCALEECYQFGVRFMSV
jgi:DNA invertase Pin-like site-specific DNA recombinase